jgi:hypothetical protein
VKPLHKKGEKLHFFLLTNISKVFEKIVYSQLLRHLSYSNILAEEQIQFRKNLTTEEASYELGNEIVNALNIKSVQGGILCDSTKVFDCDNHDMSLSKLNFY